MAIDPDGQKSSATCRDRSLVNSLARLISSPPPSLLARLSFILANFQLSFCVKASHLVLLTSFYDTPSLSSRVAQFVTKCYLLYFLHAFPSLLIPGGLFHPISILYIGIYVTFTMWNYPLYINASKIYRMPKMGRQTRKRLTFHKFPRHSMQC